MDLKKIANYIFELNTLKKFSHSGFKLAGVSVVTLGNIRASLALEVKQAVYGQTAFNLGR